MAKLTAKQVRFVQECLIEPNAAQAAIRAGYSHKTARVIGAQNLSKLNVAAAIEKAQAKRAEARRADGRLGGRRAAQDRRGQHGRLLEIDHPRRPSLISGHGSLASVAGAEIGAEGDAASTPRGFSGCGEFPALFTTRAMRSRRRALSASLSGARHGLVPTRKGQLGQFTAVHLRTSSLEPPQQSRQCARITAVGAIGPCPSARSSSSAGRGRSVARPIPSRCRARS